MLVSAEVAVMRTLGADTARPPSPLRRRLHRALLACWRHLASFWETASVPFRAGEEAGAEAASLTLEPSAPRALTSPEWAPGPRTPRGSLSQPLLTRASGDAPQLAVWQRRPGGGDLGGSPHRPPRLCHAPRGPEVAGTALPAWGGGTSEGPRLAPARLPHSVLG